MTGDTQPTQPLPRPDAQWVLAAPAAPPRRRRMTPWIVGVAVVALLAVGAWIAGEFLARSIVTTTIRQQIVSQLSLPADHPVEVDLPGPVLPQLVGGRIAELTLSSQDVAYGELSGDIVVHATGIPIRGDAPAESARATVSLGEQQLRALLGTMDGFPVETVTLDDPDIAMTTELELWVLTVSVGVGLTPRVEAGELVLTPSTLRVAGAELSAEALLAQFGPLASSVLRDWKVCVAQYLPAGLVLTGIRFDGDAVVADVDIDGAILHDTTLQANGSCA